MRPVVFSILPLLLAACSDSQTSQQGSLFNDGLSNQQNQNVDFETSALLNDIAEHVIEPTFEQFVAVSQQTSLAISSYCQELEATQSDNVSTLVAAQSAWRQQMNIWQQIEMMQIGPLQANESSLRNAIYSWPVTNQCAVDQDVGKAENETNYAVASRTAPRKGLDALEYLLFSDSVNHSCPNDDLAPTGWNERPEIEKRVARCQFASLVSQNIEVDAATLLNEWSKTAGFKAELLSTGTSESQFESDQKAINHITDALFYLDTITKDIKLAAPIGLKANSCGSASCVQDIESALSNHSLENIRNNLIGIRNILVAGDQENHIGFDDYLIAVDAEALAETMVNDIDATIELIASTEGTLVDKTLTNPEQVQNLYQSVKVVTDNLKSLFITSLALELPATSAGDAD